MTGRDDRPGESAAAAGGAGAVMLGVVAAFAIAFVGAWIWLYPIQSLVTVGAWALATELARPAANGLTDFNFYFVQYGLPAMVGIATAICTSRIDQRMGELALYRALRHVVRLAMAFVAVLALHAFVQFDVVCLTPECFANAARASKGIPVFLAVGAVVVAHFALRSGLRDAWHESLTQMHLRPSDADSVRPGVATFAAAGALPLAVAGGLRTHPPDLPWRDANMAPPASAPVVPAKRSPAETAVLAEPLREALGVTAGSTSYRAIREWLAANGAVVTADRPPSRDGYHLLVTEGPAGYRRDRLRSVRYMFVHDALVSVSVAVDGPHPAGDFERRVRALRARYDVRQRLDDYVLLTGTRHRLTYRMTDGILVEFYEFGGSF